MRFDITQNYYLYSSEEINIITCHFTQYTYVPIPIYISYKGTNIFIIPILSIAIKYCYMKNLLKCIMYRKL